MCVCVRSDIFIYKLDIYSVSVKSNGDESLEDGNKAACATFVQSYTSPIPKYNHWTARGGSVVVPKTDYQPGLSESKIYP